MVGDDPDEGGLVIPHDQIAAWLRAWRLSLEAQNTLKPA